MHYIFGYLYGGLMLLIWLGAVPVCMGLPFAGLGSEDRKHLRTAWICGFIEMLAAFQLVALVFILTTGTFTHIVYTFAVVSLVLCVISAIWVYRKNVTLDVEKDRLIKGDKENRITNLILWGVFFGIVLFQIYKSVTLSFADGDDAFYIPISAATVETNHLYQTIPYTGEYTMLDMRHALAPFPVWIAFLSKVSGIHATVIAHSILGPVLILLCYNIYYRLAHLLFKNNTDGIPIFMVLVSVLYLVGNYSFYTVETFLLTRTAQGKAVLGNVVIPFLFFCLMQMGHEFTFDGILQEEHRRPNRESDKRKILMGILVTLATIASWLCSTMGLFLSCALIGISGVIIALTYRNAKAIVYAFGCCIPSLFFLIFYMVIA